MPLSNCKINLIFWQIMPFLKGETFTITDTKLYALVVTLSTQDNAKLLQELDPGIIGINWNKYQTKRNNTGKTNISIT